MNGYELAWAAIILYCIVMYVILDGFTLGTGMISVFLPEDEADIAMSVILPTWDGNQTWLVLGFACLYGAFPIAFGMIMPILYLPLLIMGIFLLFRGVAFEFRLKSHLHKYRWTVIFAFAALVVAFIEGMILGDFIQGFDVDITNQVIVSHHIFSGFSFFTGVSLIFGYLLLGSTRLLLKTEGTLRDKMYRLAAVSALLLTACVFVASVWTPFLNPYIASKWLNLQLWPYLVPLPAIAGIAFLVMGYTLIKKIDEYPYWAAVIMFLCPYAGFCVSVYPYIIPYKLVYWNAASGVSTLRFTIVGACIMLPLLTGYTYYSYRVFRGKVREVLSY